MSGTICLGEDREQKRKMREIINGEAMKAIMKDPMTEGLDAKGESTFKWLWQKYNNGDPFDFQTIKIHDYQVKAFEQGVLKDWLPSLNKRAGIVSRFFKLPKALVRGIKGGEEFVSSIGESVSYNQRQLKEGARHIAPMMEGFFKMFNDKDSPIIKQAKSEWTKRSMKNFKIMKKYC
jgi:hypothetical protein